MEKLTLKNNQIFDAVPLAVTNNDIAKRRKLTFKTALGYAEVMTVLSDPDNISQITYSLESGIVIGVYTDCVSLKSLSVDIDKGTYTAEFSTDATEVKIKQMQEQIDMLTVRNQEIQQAIDVLTGMAVAPETPETETPETETPEQGAESPDASNIEPETPEQINTEP